MLVFPQILPAGVAQFPIERRELLRTVTAVTPGGAIITRMDDDNRISWVLEYSGLHLDEAVALESFFLNAAGRLQSFVFLDPLANLLRWSEDLTQSVWSAATALQVTPGISDPQGSSRAFRITNPLATAARISQTIDAPASYLYCFSFYARSTAPTTIRLFQQAQARETIANAGLSPSWRRIVRAARLDSDANSVSFGVEIPPGGAVELFAPQVEPQIAPSPYLPSKQNSGVCPKVRFDQDEMTVRADNFNSYSTRLQLVTAGAL
jgi:hypothetical protein